MRQEATKMPTEDRRAGPNGARRRERRETKALRAATLAGMIYRTRHPTHVRAFVESVEDESDSTGDQFDAFLFPERVRPDA